MGNIWCVAPETEKLDLDFQGNPFWVQVKKQLNMGEKRKIETAGFRGMTGFTDNKQQRTDRERDTEISIDWRAQSFARMEMYLTAWSLDDGAGNVLPLTNKRDALEALRPEVYEVIEAGLNAHIERMDAAKKAEPGAATLSATSA